MTTALEQWRELEAMLANADDFRTIPGWGKYEVSPRGIVRIKNGRTISQRTTEKGYKTVSFFMDGRKRFPRVHRLVAETFISDIPAGMQINHIDGNKSNNLISNLEIATPSQNVKHASNLGLLAFGSRNGMITMPERKPKGEACGNSKLKNFEVLSIYKDKRSCLVIATEYGVNFSTVQNIRTGRTWAHLTKHNRAVCAAKIKEFENGKA